MLKVAVVERETESKDEKWKEGSVARMQRAALSRVPKPKTYTSKYIQRVKFAKCGVVVCFSHSLKFARFDVVVE